MAKELPYFKFEPAEYLTKNISFCSLQAQGLFVNVCCYYWQRNCNLTVDQLLRRLSHRLELDELIKEGIIDLEKDKISIKFLDKQLQELSVKSKINKINGSKGGRPLKNPIITETKPNDNLNHNLNHNLIESESKGIREEEIRKEESRVDKIKIKKTLLSKIEISDVEDSLKPFFLIAIAFQEIFIKNLQEKNASTVHQEKAIFENYVNPIRLMITNKECSVDDLRDVAKYLRSPSGEFWKSNILSTTALRKNIGKIVMKAREVQTNNNFNKTKSNEQLLSHSAEIRSRNPNI